MNNIVKIIIGAIVVFAIGFIVGGVGKVSESDLGRAVYNWPVSFDEGIEIDGTEIISGTRGASFTTGAFSGTLTISDIAYISDASSTIQIGDTTSGIGVGCIVLGDSAGATSTPVYITATGNTISATQTKPAICQ